MKSQGKVICMSKGLHYLPGTRVKNNPYVPAGITNKESVVEETTSVTDLQHVESFL